MEKREVKKLGMYACPHCGRFPRVGTYNVNFAWAECRGGLFRRHKKLRYETGYMRPSVLLTDLVAGWNKTAFERWFEEVWPEECRRKRM